MNAKQRRLLVISASILGHGFIVAFFVALTLLPRLCGVPTPSWEVFMGLVTFNMTGQCAIEVFQTLRIWK